MMHEIEISEQVGSVLWGLRKGAGHKYIRRVPKPGGGYRYYYRTAGVTRGVGADLVPGAKFKLTHEGQPGHFEVVRRSGDRVVLKHDESGASMTVSAEALGDLLKREHADVVSAQRERTQRRLDAARKHGSPKQIARLEAEAQRFGDAGGAAEREKSPPGSLLDELHYETPHEFISHLLQLERRGVKFAAIRDHEVMEGLDPTVPLMQLWEAGEAVPVIGREPVQFGPGARLPSGAIWYHPSHMRLSKQRRADIPYILQSVKNLGGAKSKEDIRTEADVRRLIDEAELVGASTAVKRELQSMLQEFKGRTSRFRTADWVPPEQHRWAYEAEQRRRERA